MKTFFLGGGASQEDILGLAISLIFDQFSILSTWKCNYNMIQETFSLLTL